MTAHTARELGSRPSRRSGEAYPDGHALPSMSGSLNSSQTRAAKIEVALSPTVSPILRLRIRRCVAKAGIFADHRTWTRDRHATLPQTVVAARAGPENQD